VTGRAATVICGAGALLVGLAAGLGIGVGDGRGRGRAGAAAGAAATIVASTTASPTTAAASATVSPPAESVANTGEVSASVEATRPEAAPIPDAESGFARLVEALRRLGPLLPREAASGATETADPPRERRISGRVVLPDGTPAEGALVRARWDWDPYAIYRARYEDLARDDTARAHLEIERDAARRTALARTDREGRYALEAPREALVRLVALHEGLTCMPEEGANAHAEDPPEIAAVWPTDAPEVSFTAPLPGGAGVIRGVVTFPPGETTVHHEVTVLAERLDGAPAAPAPAPGDDGENEDPLASPPKAPTIQLTVRPPFAFAFSGLASGRWALRAGAAGAGASPPVEVVPGAADAAAHVTLTAGALDRSYAIQVHLETPGGEPARRVRFAALSDPDEAGRSEALGAVRSCLLDDGSFLLHLEWDDRERVSSRGMGWSLRVTALEGEATLRVPPGAAGGASFALRLGAPSPRGDLVVRLHGAIPPGRLRTRLLDREHADGRRDDPHNRRGEGVSAEGVAAYDGVPAGAAELVVLYAAAEAGEDLCSLARYPITVAPGACTLELTLPAARDAALQAHVPGLVDVWRLEGTDRWTQVVEGARTDAAGRLSLLLEDGAYAAIFAPTVVAPAPEDAPRLGRRDERFHVPLEGATEVRLPE